ncbi:Crinkler (CRN) [Phytophthora megakarya]|uniref:Crinkler (CRN) n=1 Tax=Phytophthora megakarya TaxID=4795 RepID=A0A225UN00_9STRA|nr:Crinkler (CRN) [Phytophthora megakarya]
MIDPKSSIRAILLKRWYRALDATSSTCSQTEGFKTVLIERYGDMEMCEDEQTLRTRVKILTFGNIDNVMNGLLLFKPLKHAFDCYQISFIYYKDDEEFRLKIFDRSLRQQLLFDKLSDHEKTILFPQNLPENWRTRAKCMHLTSLGFIRMKIKLKIFRRKD